MKFLKRLTLFVLGCIMAFGMIACDTGGGPINNNNQDIEQADDTDRSGWVPFEKATFAEGTKLRIKFFKGGYGRGWIDAMKEKFEKDYPNVEVILTPSTNETEFTTTISTTLEGNPDDIYVCHNIPWEKLSVRKLIMNLDSLYNSVVYTDTKNDDKPIRFVDRIASSSLNAVQFNGSFYSIPEIQGAGGLAYNKAMFDKYGWKVPTTYEELIALCAQIASENRTSEDGESKIYPFVWSGTTAYLWDSLVYDWWVQIAGMDEFKEFMKYETKDLFDSEKYPALKKAWTYWYDLLCANKAYSHPQSLAFNHLDANTTFAAGYAAMMPATCWAANEVGTETLEEFGCDMGIIPTPVVPEAKKDDQGNVIHVAYDMAGKDSFVIAQKSKNKQVAIEFFKWMAIEENALLFPENANGLLLAMRYDFDNLINNVAKTTWEKGMFSLLKNSTRFNLYSSSPLVYNAGTPLSPYPEGNFYLEAFENYGTSDAKTPDGVFDGRWTKIQNDWETMCLAAGITPK